MTTAAVETRNTWTIDPSHTTVEFVAKHMMITTVKGRFAELTGTIVADESNIADSSVEATLQAASLDTRNEQRDAHLRSPDFLDVENYPTVTFRSTRVEGTKDEFQLTGDLTIRGVTRPVTLQMKFNGYGVDPLTKEDKLGFSAQGHFSRSQFGLGTWYPAVGDDVRVRIEAEFARHADAEAR